jgi:hypothetical protein
MKLKRPRLIGDMDARKSARGLEKNTDLNCNDYPIIRRK